MYEGIDNKIQCKQKEKEEHLESNDISNEK